MSIKKIEYVRLYYLLVMILTIGYTSSIYAQFEIDRVSVSGSGLLAIVPGYSPALSSDGRYLLMCGVNAISLESDGPANNYNVFRKDTQTGKVELVSKNNDGSAGNSGCTSTNMSGDGRYAVFSSSSSNLVADDVNGKRDVFLRDMVLGTIERISISDSETESNGNSSGGFVSDDGRFIAFSSAGTNLVQSGSNSTYDVYLRDRLNQTTTRVNVSSTGANVTSSSSSSVSSISIDGRYVVFSSNSTGLTFNSSSTHQVYLRDTDLGVTVLVSHRGDGPEAANGNSTGGVITADGLYILFVSDSSVIQPNAFPYQKNSLYKYTISLGYNEQVTVAGINGSYGVSTPIQVSYDGTYATYKSDATNLVPNDTNGVADIFLTNTVTKTSSLISLNSAGEQAAVTHLNVQKDSKGPGISRDGRYITFTSGADNLIKEDFDGFYNMFTRDIQTSTTYLAISKAAGYQLGSGSASADVSGNGRYLAFTSQSTDVIDGGVTGSFYQAYLRDMETGVITLLSRRAPEFDDFRREGNGHSISRPSVSNNGSAVFYSSASNLLNGGNSPGLFLYDLQSDNLKLIGGPGGGIISADGKYVVIRTNEALDGADTNGAIDVYLYDVDAETSALISLDSNGNVLDIGGNPTSISPNGRFVVFESSSSLVVQNDTNNRKDVFLIDLQLGSTIRVSVDSSGNEGDKTSSAGVVSDAGDVAFQSDATNLVASDTNFSSDIFVYDYQTGLVTRVNVDDDGEEANDSASSPSISKDGRFIGFTSSGSNLVLGSSDGNAVTDAFVHDRANTKTIRVSQNVNGDDGDGRVLNGSVRVVNEGEAVLFASSATNMIPSDTNALWDIFLASNTLLAQSVLDDFGGDQKADILLYSSGLERLFAFEMDGASILTSKGVANIPNWSVVDKSNDFNGDGRADILLRHNSSHALNIFLMDGNIVSSSKGIAKIPGWSISGIADFNGDNKADILLQNDSTGIIVMFLMNGNEIQDSSGIAKVPDWTVAATSDHNGDGKADILLYGPVSHKLHLFTMNGTNITASQGVANIGAWTVSDVSDYTADSKADILLYHPTLDKLHLYTMNGSTISASAGADSLVGYTLEGHTDLDGDNKTDLLVRDSANKLHAWIKDGAITTDTGILSPVNGWSIADLADYDGDGDNDVLLQHDTNDTLHMLRTDGKTVIQSKPVGRPIGWEALE